MDQLRHLKTKVSSKVHRLTGVGQLPPDHIADTRFRYVFTHFILGNSTPMSVEDWCSDIELAKSAGIDAFGLNIASSDPNNDANLSRAFQAAESLESDFKLYLNFDYLAGEQWDTNSVISRINQCARSRAYFRYLNRPFVSTFEGVENVTDWAEIRQATNCFFVPDWSSLGPAGASKHLGRYADGLASWNAWPEGENGMTTDEDELYIKRLGGRPYMIPVSPWFYTNLPQYGKNWLWRSDDLWHERWKHVISLAPKAQFVQIITWNDYGESHYIGPIRPRCVPDGTWYVDGQDHQGWLTMLPHYIAAYKSGQLEDLTSPPSATHGAKERLVMWYRTNPGQCGSHDGTTGNNPGYQKTHEPHKLLEDKIMVTAMLESLTDVAVRIGGGAPHLLHTVHPGISHFSVPFGDQTGAVTAEAFRDGETVLYLRGPEITTSCTDGKVNWNPVVARTT